jgi:hypothetical protein
VKKLLWITNFVLFGANILVLSGLLWFGSRSTPVAYAHMGRIAHQQNELDSLSAELAAAHQK